MVYAFSRNLCSFEGVATAFASSCLPSALAWWRDDEGPWRCVRPALILVSDAEECHYLGSTPTFATLITIPTLSKPSKERHHPAPGQTWQHRSTDQTMRLQTVRETAKKTDGLERSVSHPSSSPCCVIPRSFLDAIRRFIYVFMKVGLLTNAGSF